MEVFLFVFYLSWQLRDFKLLEATALSLSHPSAFFVKLCNQNTSELRLNHYPGVLAKELLEGCNRISEHTDFGTLTLLFQDSVGGLEIERQDCHGTFIPIKADDPTEMIVNVGDCLQRWTNDALCSANHRVTLPEGQKDIHNAMIEGRYSVAYFGKPNRETLVSTMPEFVSRGAHPKYVEKLTAWEYNQVKLLKTY